MNKKGSDKVISMYWFVIVIIVALGIFAMVYVFYSAPYDIRDVESEILSSKIVDCLSRNGNINAYFISGEGINILDNCSLTFKVENELDWEKSEQYFFEVEIIKLNKEDPSNSIVFSGGNINWKEDCFIEDKKGKDYKKLITCNEKRVYAVDSLSNQYLIKVLSGVGKNEKNIKQ